MTTMRDYKAKKPKTFPVHVVLVLQVDGEPKQTIALPEQQIPMPSEGQVVQLALALDTRVLAQLVEQVLGPQSKLWTPGQGKPVVLAQKD